MLELQRITVCDNSGTEVTGGYARVSLLKQREIYYMYHIRNRISTNYCQLWNGK